MTTEDVTRMDDGELGLAEAVAAVRSELIRAQDSGRGSDVRFAVDAVEMTFTVEATRKSGGEASIKVLSLLSLGAKGEQALGETHRVTVTLTPLGEHGVPFEVASASNHRPDSTAVE